MKFSEKMGGQKANILLDLDMEKRRLEAQGAEVINLSIGTPDFQPDRHVMEAASRAALNPENYKYSITDSPALVEAVIGWYASRYGVTLTPGQITSVYGTQEGMAHIAFPVCDPGDLCFVPDPGYPIFSFGPFLAGAELVKLPLVEKNRYLIDFDSIDPAVADKAKLLVTSYPNNPLTACADEDFYERLVFFAKRHDILVVHDNAYSELILDGEPGISFLSVKGASEVGIEFNSLSKSYNLTGLRISFALGNEQVIQKFKSFRSQIDYGTCSIVQQAAVAALTGPQDILERNRAGYRERQDALCGGLRSIGWDVPDSKGTMFTWFPIPKGYRNSEEFTFELLAKAGVLCVPGASFGALGEGFVRMALVQPVETMQRAVDKIAQSGVLNR